MTIQEADAVTPQALINTRPVTAAVKEFFAKDLDFRLPDGSVSARTEAGVAYRYARAFRRESENLYKMKHPGIVHVLEAFEANGTFYYAMEYLSGGSLDNKVKGVGMPEAEALPMIAPCRPRLFRRFTSSSDDTPPEAITSME